MMLKRILKYTGLLLGLIFLAIGLFVGVIWITHYWVASKLPQTVEIPKPPTGYGQYVNTFIGTGSYPWVCGHNFPGASVPFSMVRLSPETASIFLNEESFNTSGYHYWNNKIVGFSHNRLSGTGATDGGQFRFVPGYGEQTRIDYRNKEYIPFSHEDEIAYPGYYSVDLKDRGVIAELTTTSHAGVHRYTFEKNDQPHLLIDISSAIDNKRTNNGIVKIKPETSEIEGAITAHGSFGGRYGGSKVYFSAKFDQKFDSYGIWNGKKFFQSLSEAEGDTLGIDIGFGKTTNPLVVNVQVGISYVNIENARLNRTVETSGKNFEDILLEAKSKWEEKLSLIKIEGATEEQKTIFYTALYRSFIMPTMYTDVNGEYHGFDKQVHQMDSAFNYYTDLSLWDTYRTLHPLYNLIAQKEQRDMLVSMVKMKEQGGYLPRWPSGSGYSNSMLASPASMMIAESYLKGITDFDVESAYEGMKYLGTQKTPKETDASGRRSIEEYLQYEYCPSEVTDRSVSKTLEYAWADYSNALLARALGHEEDASRFLSQSNYYKNTWNPETQYFQPRRTDGTFDPIEPLQLTYTDYDGILTDDYVEGSALQWRWMVPHDPQGLIALFKSKAYFVEELNSFFEKADPDYATFSPGSYYWHGNQPDIHAAYLFNEAGRPDLTQKWVRWILDNKYKVESGGLDGNDDGATLSSWYVLSAMGIYPMAGTDKYQLTSPLFDNILLPIGDATLEIVVNRNNQSQIYIERIELNGNPLDRYWLSHEEIAKGGKLEFFMKELE